ncbi:branched-chain amino acid ABC transporter permease [Amphibiibacter pelophylacis]|uniref:Branched-chain amino acid ABC transporter permease n=1 Tax=Amphibiibacter pelophylacis TaxID=1799477 RepID=A0ACC6P463_9BURK
MNPSSLAARHRDALLLAAVLLALAALASVAAPGLQRTLTEGLIRVVTVLGLFVFVGQSGVISFGHIAFMGVGAYAAAWLTMDPAIKPFVLGGLPEWLQALSLPWWQATLAGGALAAVAAAVTGIAILRLTGIAASIATFSLLAIFNVVYSSWDSVTAGTSSIVGVPTTVGIPQALGVALLALLLAEIHRHSRWGLALQAVREEPVAAQSCGIRALRMKLIAFVLSALVCGAAGALNAQYLGVVSPDEYYLPRTFITLAMLVIGGMSSLRGAVGGTVLISLLMELLTRLEAGVTLGSTTLALPHGAQEIAIGLLMIVMLIVRPHGLWTR